MQPLNKTHLSSTVDVKQATTASARDEVTDFPVILTEKKEVKYKARFIYKCSTRVFPLSVISIVASAENPGDQPSGSVFGQKILQL